MEREDAWGWRASYSDRALRHINRCYTSIFVGVFTRKATLEFWCGVRLIRPMATRRRAARKIRGLTKPEAGFTLEQR